MKQQSGPAHGKGRAKPYRKSREELDMEARDRKRQKKHRGNVSGSRGNVSAGSQDGNGSSRQQKDPRIGSKKPIALGVTDAPVKPKQPQHKPKSEKPMLTPQAELDLLENDERLDGLLERMEAGETLAKEDRQWVNEKLDRIDSLMQQLGLSYDDDEPEEEEAQEDMMRLLRGNN